MRAPQSVTTTSTIGRSVRHEAILLAACLAFGLLLLPAAVFLVGQTVFGEFGGDGIGGFYGELYGRLANADLVVWFLVLSPYLFWQSARLTFMTFRRLGRQL